MKNVLPIQHTSSSTGRNLGSASIDQVFRLPQVKALTGLGKSSIYAAMRQGNFPASRSLGARAIGWFQSDIINWLESRKPAKPSHHHKEVA
ncbi:helix-turn-helix transcriptional regulator [Undibacterium sp. SXout7W]|uniref:helix-turn-helix transcriptional regulator n=1 Tax=Undibacterium sp. SXout7W TaxID=3413049 RepID=UPI003BF427B8